MTIDNIPNELKALPRWVCYDGKKVPINPSTGERAKCNDPSTWSTIACAELGIARWGCKGVGFQLGDGLCGIDIDRCVEDGVLSEMAQEVISTMNTYTEFSPSGTGVHLLFKGEVPAAAGYYTKNPKNGMELYAGGSGKGRYFTVTGNRVANTPFAVEERTAEVAAVREKYMRKASPASPPRKPQPVSFNLNDDKLLEKAFTAKNGQTFKQLWHGDTSGYPSPSEAELALCNMLAFWTGCNPEQMDRLFRSSSLMRDKWDRPQSGTTYGALNIQKAITDCKAVYDPNSPEQLEKRRKRAIEQFSSRARTDSPVKDFETLRKDYTFDDLGAARLYADTFRDNLLYLPEYKSYWAYFNGVWQRDEDNLIAEGFAKHLADLTGALVPPPPTNADEDDEFDLMRKHYKKYGAYKHRRTQVMDAKSEIKGSSSDFDTDPFLFNCKNGTLDLKTMNLRPHNPKDRLSKKANVNFDPSARCERFEQFIDEIACSNADRANMLQKALGYCLKGEANEECYFTCIGEKTRNGKGTLFDTVLHIFGSYGAQIDFNSIARGGARDGSRPTPDIARLVGIRFVLSNEPEKGVCLNEALLKQLTGNDDITARLLFSNVIQFKPVFRIFVTANSKPTVSDDSLFTSGRVKLLPFLRHFSEEERDTSLKASFRTESAKSGILNWLLEGYQKYVKEGLKDTPEMKALTEQYRKENDYIGQYLDERFNFHASGSTTIKLLRKDYENWCEVIGAKPLGLKLFTDDLTKRDIHISQAKGRKSIRGQITPGYDYVGEADS